MPADITQIPSVSVVVPNFNKEKTLAACLDAIFAQTYPSIDVTVVDDASTDASITIARSYPCRLIEFPDNQGVSVARNTGTGQTQGDVLFFVDSDIALAPDAIANAVRQLLDDPECGIVQGIYDAEPLFDDGPVERYRCLCENFWRRRASGVVPMTLFALTAIRRGVVEAVGGFRPDLRDAEDVEFGTRLPAGVRIRMSPTVLGRHDDVDRLVPMLSEQVRRAKAFAALVTGGSSPQRLRAFSLITLLCTAAVLGFTVLGVVYHPLWLIAAVFALGFLISEAPLLNFARQRQGLRFVPYFVAVHFLLYAATLIGAATAALTALRPTRSARARTARA